MVNCKFLIALFPERKPHPQPFSLKMRREPENGLIPEESQVGRKR
jgi:hypothetical protein